MEETASTENSQGFFQGKVLAKLESIEAMQHLQQQNLAMKAEDKALQAHIESDRIAFSKINDSFDNLSQQQKELRDDVMKIIGMGILASIIITVIGSALIIHFWH